VRISVERRGNKEMVERMMGKEAVSNTEASKSYDQTPRNVNFAEPWKLRNYRGNMFMPSGEVMW
jgi:hypothetical protein